MLGKFSTGSSFAVRLDNLGIYEILYTNVKDLGAEVEYFRICMFYIKEQSGCPAPWL